MMPVVVIVKNMLRGVVVARIMMICLAILLVRIVTFLAVIDVYENHNDYNINSM